MKFFRQGVCLAMLGAGLAAVPATIASQASASPTTTTAVAGDRGLVRDLRDQADGSVTVADNSATGQIGFLRARGAKADLLPSVAGNSAALAADKADAFVDKYGSTLGAASGELVRQGVSASSLGWTVRYAQVYKGIPVFGSMIKANLDRDGDLTAVNGFAAPGIDVSTDPNFSAAEIGKRAVAFVKADPPTSGENHKPSSTTGLEAKNAQLVVYRIGFVRGEPGKTVLAYVVEVTNGAVRDQLVYDAQTGKVLNRYSLGTDALDRELYEASGTETAPVFTKVWEEGQPFPGTLNQDQQNLVNSSGESYWFFMNTFARDSYDGAGATRITVNNDPRIDCPNANWNGATTNYCDGVTSDDVVAHEWGHAYTEYTSGLIYQYQSGALNESYSDVWGETLDMVNGREDEGETFNTKRPDGECDPTAPAKLQMNITAPAGAAGPCTAAAAGFGPEITTTPINATIVVATDAANPTGPSTTDGCTAYTNAGAVTGKWAYVDRGTCTFQVKADIAAAAGAVGIVVGDNAPDRVPTSMSGTSTIYGVMVTQADGTRIKGAGGPVTATIQAEDISTRTASTRWLMGEKSEAFGGAIRDMWTPTCYGHPGKVTDAEYNCDPLLTDNGGVHGNSGVPNHAYALAVDGGTYNGQTITGMGLDQAASVWWRAQTAYLTPSSNFTDMADALATACTDQVGKPINKLTTAPNATPVAATPVTAANCAELAKVITAVQLKTPPTKCNFQPLLDKNTPSLCGPGLTTEELYTENFEDGLTGLAASQELAPEGGHGGPWEASTSAPDNHPGGVAYGPAPDEGQCDGSDDDFSSRDSIATPTIQVPSGNLASLRLSFDQYIATEALVDGGNVKLSINGGAFTAPDSAAYVFNGPTGELLSDAQGNTNPMASEDAFTGTDGGESKGSWGTSQLDLAAAGVEPGDTVQLRFDVGRDGCGGVDGWYVDNVSVTLCKAAATVTASHTPEPAVFGQASTVKVQVRRGPQSAGSAPSGVVVLRDQAGTNLGEASLNTDGDAQFTLPGTTPVGSHTYKVEYKGNDTFAPVSGTVKVTVAKATSTVTASAPAKVKYKKNFDVDATVVPPGTGTVEVYQGSKHLGTGTLLPDGTVTITITWNLKPGKHTLTVKYLGSANVAAGQTTVKVKVQKKKKG